MQKAQKRKARTSSICTLRVTVAMSLLVAMSIVCGKYLAFGVGQVLRFSFENLPVMLAGIFFGPVAGIVTGVVADLVGCIMVGYAVNPFVTLGAAVIGGVSGLIYKLLKGHTSFCHGVCVAVSVAISHALGSVLIKTAGLAAFYSMPFEILLPWRLLNYAIIAVLEIILIYAVTKNKSVNAMILHLKGGNT